MSESDLKSFAQNPEQPPKQWTPLPEKELYQCYLNTLYKPNNNNSEKLRINH